MPNLDYALTRARVKTSAEMTQSYEVADSAVVNLQFYLLADDKEELQKALILLVAEVDVAGISLTQPPLVRPSRSFVGELGKNGR